LEGLIPRDVAKLLDRAGDRFTSEDRRIIMEAAGQHPYLLQAAAYYLWEAYEEDISDKTERWQLMSERLYKEHYHHFAATWQIWSEDMRRAFSTIAIFNLNEYAHNFLQENELISNVISFDLKALVPPNELQKTGMVIQDKRFPLQWRIGPQTMLWWIKDELGEVLADERKLVEWLHVEHLTDNIAERLRFHVGKIGQGIQAHGHDYFQALVSGMVEGVVGGLTG